MLSSLISPFIQVGYEKVIWKSTLHYRNKIIQPVFFNHCKYIYKLIWRYFPDVFNLMGFFQTQEVNEHFHRKRVFNKLVADCAGVWINLKRFPAFLGAYIPEDILWGHIYRSVTFDSLFNSKTWKCLSDLPTNSQTRI